MALKAKQKKKRGEKLSPAEAKAFKEYVAWNNARASTIYWSTPEECEAMKARAAAAGVGRFSEWCTQMIRLTLKGESIDPRILEELVAKNADLKRRLEEQQDLQNEYRAEAKEWSTRYRQLADELAGRAADKLQRAARRQGAEK